MLREHQNVIDRFHIFCAGIFCFVGFLMTYFSFYATERVDRIFSYLPAMVIFSTAMVITLLMRRVTISGRFVNYIVLLKEVVIATALSFMVYGFVSYGFKLTHLSRLYVFSSITVCFFATLLWFSFSFWFYSRARENKMNMKNILVVGNQFTVEAVVKMIHENPALGLNIVGLFPVSENSFDEDTYMGHPVYNNHLHHSLDSFFNTFVVDCVFMTVYRQDPQMVEKIILSCQDRGIEVWLKPDFMHRGIEVSKADHLANIPVFVFSMGPQQSTSLMIKRAIDFSAGLALLTVFSVPMLLIAYLIRRESPGPVVFVQKRVGLNGRKFHFYKFRSMYQDAEQRREAYKQKNEMEGPVFKMKDDPRITPIGRVLRKYSLDELPQIWNVVKGDMSLVGPRPPIPSEVDLYRGWHRRRLSMRPGITCIWQVSGRNEIKDFQKWVQLDLKYIDNWNLFLDLKILFQTIPAVLKGTGM